MKKTNIESGQGGSYMSEKENFLHRGKFCSWAESPFWRL